MISNKICNYAPNTIFLYATVELPIMEHNSVETAYSTCTTKGESQSRQSAKLFLQRRNWNSPTPLGASGCAPPPPFGPGGRAHSLAAKGLGESQFRRGDIHCGALYM
jgi:hypothetical protein